MTKPLVVAIGALLLAGCGLTPNASVGPVASGTLSAASTKPKISAMNFAQVTDPKNPGLLLYRGGLPSDDDMQGLVKLGVTTDVNLLDPASNDAPLITHEQAVCKQLGITFINIALPWGVQPPMSMVDTFLSAAKASGKGHGVYVHCKHGRDRTGTMVASYRIEDDGYTAAQALSEMETFGYDPNAYPWFTQFIQNLAANP